MPSYVHGAVGERRIRRVNLEGQPAPDAAPIETGKAEAALDEGGAVILRVARPEGSTRGSIHM